MAKVKTAIPVLRELSPDGLNDNIYAEFVIREVEEGEPIVPIRAKWDEVIDGTTQVSFPDR